LQHKLEKGREDALIRSEKQKQPPSGRAGRGGRGLGGRGGGVKSKGGNGKNGFRSSAAPANMVCDMM
jgi:hypothetical protein